MLDSAAAAYATPFIATLLMPLPLPPPLPPLPLIHASPCRATPALFSPLFRYFAADADSCLCCRHADDMLPRAIDAAMP